MVSLTVDFRTGKIESSRISPYNVNLHHPVRSGEIS